MNSMRGNDIVPKKHLLSDCVFWGVTLCAIVVGAILIILSQMGKR
jgi:hypothetical protein